MAYGFGKKSVPMGTQAKRGYYVPGQGTFEREVHAYKNGLGESVYQSAGLLRNNDGTLHEAYKVAPGTSAGDAVMSVQGGIALTPEERMALIDAIRKAGFPVSDSASDDELRQLAARLVGSVGGGLPTIDDLGGNHNGGTRTGGSNSSAAPAGTYKIKGKPGWYTSKNFS